MRSFETKIEDTINLIGTVYSKSKMYLSKFNGTGLKEIEKILGILVLDRITYNLYSTKLLLSELLKNPGIEHSIGLVLRNNLSLCKIVFKQVEIKDNTPEKLKKFYQAIFGENIQRTIKEVKKNYTQSEYKPSIKNISKNYSFLLRKLDIDINKIEDYKFNSNLKLSNKFDSLEKLHDAYSKYEHFGLNTLILQSDNNENEILDRINIAVHYSLQGVLTCLLLLDIVDKELLEILKKLFEKARTHNNR